MQIAPLSLVPKEVSSPHKVLNHHDSLIFSITSQKMISHKSTLLLDDSRQMKKSPEQCGYKDYFIIQQKIKLLQEKVGNIKTQYCESEKKQETTDEKQNRHEFINLEFPEQIYCKKSIMIEEQSSIGKIKRKKSKYYVGLQKKNRQKFTQTSKNQQSITSTKRNNSSAYNVNDFSVYRGRNSFSKYNQTDRDLQRNSRERSSSFSLKAKKDVKIFFGQNNNSQLRNLKQEMTRNRLSNQKLSRKSKQSQRKLSKCKIQVKKIQDQNSILQKQMTLLKQKLKKSETIKERQKQTIQKQRQQITELRGFLQEFLKRNNDESMRELLFNQKDLKTPKLRMLR